MTATEFRTIRTDHLRLSQAALGLKVHRHRNTIMAYESGARAIDPNVVTLMGYLLTATRPQEETR